MVTAALEELERLFRQGMLLAAAAASGLGAYAKAKIGGQTGDILGASQQLAEAAVLLVAASL